MAKGMTVRISGHGPLGFVGIVQSVEGHYLTVRTSDGYYETVDVTRRTIAAIQG